jgi:GNAT superfamily N-acetyltransferase
MINTMTSNIIIRNISKRDIPKIVALQKRSFPEVAAGTVFEPSFLEDHITLFPQGQFCSELDHRIVASATNLIVLLDPEYRDHSWYDIAGNNSRLKSHNPKGDTLYGDDICTHPDFRRLGIASMLFNSRKQLAIKLNLRRVVVGGRLDHYYMYASKMTVIEYVNRVIEGKIKDPVFSFDLKNGFRFVKILSNYIYDRNSLNYATFVEWLNPYYSKNEDH